MKEDADSSRPVQGVLRGPMLAYSALAIIVAVHMGRTWSWDDPRHLATGLLALLYSSAGIALLQIAAGFLIAGYGAAAEIRSRTCVVSVVAILALHLSVPATFLWHPVEHADLGNYWSMLHEATWHRARDTFLWCLAPLLAGLSFHSTLYTLHALRRLRRTARNAAGAWLVVAVLAFDWSGLAWTMVVSDRVQARESGDLAKANSEMQAATDLLTQRFVNECPDDYHFLLLRANFLQEEGRTREATALFAQPCLATNIPERVRRSLQTESKEQRP